MILRIHTMKNMKQFTSLSFTVIKSLVLAAGFLWLIDSVTAPIGGIAIFSAIFAMGLAGFGAAVLVFHLLAKVSR